MKAKFPPYTVRGAVPDRVNASEVSAYYREVKKPVGTRYPAYVCTADELDYLQALRREPGIYAVDAHIRDVEAARSCSGRAETPHDPVTKPAHYQRGGIETIDYIRATLGDEGFIAYAIGNALKYLSRFRDKDGVQDLKKARVYLEWAVESMEKTT